MLRHEGGSNGVPFHNTNANTNTNPFQSQKILFMARELGSHYSKKKGDYLHLTFQYYSQCRNSPSLATQFTSILSHRSIPDILWAFFPNLARFGDARISYSLINLSFLARKKSLLFLYLCNLQLTCSASTSWISCINVLKNVLLNLTR